MNKHLHNIHICLRKIDRFWCSQRKMVRTKWIFSVFFFYWFWHHTVFVCRSFSQIYFYKIFETLNDGILICSLHKWLFCCWCKTKYAQIMNPFEVSEEMAHKSPRNNANVNKYEANQHQSATEIGTKYFATSKIYFYFYFTF